MYPCNVGCAEPLKGKVSFTAQPQGPESVRVTNTSSGPIDLSEYEVESVAVLLRVRARDDPAAAARRSRSTSAGDPPTDTQFVKSWGFKKFLLADRKDVVTLRNPLGAPVVCAAWGGGAARRLALRRYPPPA